MIISAAEKVPLEKCPALVLNDFEHLAIIHYHYGAGMQLNLFLNRVSIVSTYQKKVRSNHLK